MISYDVALEKVLAAVDANVGVVSEVSVTAALGRVLAEGVVASISLPPFDNSAVDGYAVRGEDLRGVSQGNPVVLPIVQEIAAGASVWEELGVGQAARIFTGAPVPPGADAVIMQEDTEREGNRVTLFAEAEVGFIRPAGSDVKVGEVALAAGTVLGAGEIGLLAALGMEKVTCRVGPKVGVLTTGDEVVSPGVGLLPGQIYDANGFALVAALQEAGVQRVVREHARDTAEDVSRALEALTDCEVIIASGGVSVGDYDVVKSTVEARGTLDFWRIAIKPGKPLAFGRIGEALFFGLPGNPVSSLVTFELFVRPVLRQMLGVERVLRPRVMATLAAPLSHVSGRREFVRAVVDWSETGAVATPTGAQGSHRLSSMVGANALLVADENRGDYEAGESLPALLLV